MLRYLNIFACCFDEININYSGHYENYTVNNSDVNKLNKREHNVRNTLYYYNINGM